MPISIRRPTREEWPLVLQSLNQSLRPAREWTLWAEYPTILSLENFAHSMVAWDQTRPVAHAAYYPYMVTTADGPLKVAGVGQVWTDPEFRGQGLAQKVLVALEGAMREHKIAFAILWTGDPRVYQKIGYTAAGCELDFWLNAENFSSPAMPQYRVLNLETFENRKRYLPAFMTLYDQHRLRVQRTMQDWQKYFTVPNSKWLVTTHGDKATAYAVIGKGEDFSYVVHDWGGQPEGVIVLLWHLLRTGGYEKLMLFSPNDPEEQLISFLKGRGLAPVEGIVGYTKCMTMNDMSYRRLIGAESSKFFLWGFDSV